MDNLLTICQNVADYIGLSRPTAVINGTNNDQRRFQSAVRKTSRALMLHDWPELLRVGSITFANGTELYDEPSDLHRIVSDTMWTSTQRIALGPIESQTFERLYREGIVTVDPTFRIRQTDDSSNFRRQVQIYPTPTDSTIMYFLYYSNQWAKSAAGTSRLSGWESDTDVPIIEDHMIELGVTWRMLNSMRRSYAEEFNDYESYVNTRLGQSKIGRVIHLHRAPRFATNLPERGFG